MRQQEVRGVRRKKRDMEEKREGKGETVKQQRVRGVRGEKRDADGEGIWGAEREEMKETEYMRRWKKRKRIREGEWRERRTREKQKKERELKMRERAKGMKEVGWERGDVDGE